MLSQWNMFIHYLPPGTFNDEEYYHKYNILNNDIIKYHIEMNCKNVLNENKVFISKSKQYRFRT